MITKNRIIIYFFCFCFLFLNNTSFSDQISGSDLLPGQKNSIDWQKGYIISKGTAQISYSDNGSPVDPLTGRQISLNRAREAITGTAKEIALANIADAISYIRVDAQNTLLDVMKSNANTQRKIADVINNRISYKEFPAGFDQSACVARLNFESIIDSLEYEFPSNDFPVRTDIPISTPYSSLIVDCRGLNIGPMLFPSIYSNAGLEIYGKNYIDVSFTHNGGMASYCYNEDQARTDIRAGGHPYFSAAVKSINNCPVLSEKDTRRLLGSQYTINNLKKCRVIFIVDRMQVSGN
jgi:hypothetical protein